MNRSWNNGIALTHNTGIVIIIITTTTTTRAAAMPGSGAPGDNLYPNIALCIAGTHKVAVTEISK